MAYDETYRAAELPHKIILEGRSKMAVSGVEDVESFDEGMIVANTVKGQLIIRGVGMHLEKLSLDSGEILINGKIDGLEYEGEESSSGGFFSRLFK